MEQAHLYTDAITAACDEIAGNPQLGTACDHIRKGYRRRRVGEHVIYFRGAEYGVAIVRILHDRMDAPRHL